MTIDFLRTALRDNRWGIGVFVVVSAAFTVLEGISIGLLIPLFQVLLADGAAPKPVSLGPIAISGGLGAMVAIVLAAIILRSTLDVLSRVQELRLKEAFVGGWRETVFERLVRVDLVRFYREGSGHYANVIIGEIYRAGFAAHSALKLFVAGLVGCVYAVILFWISVPLTGLLAIGCAGIYACNMVLFRRSRHMGRMITEARARLSVAVNESLQAMKLIRLYGREADEVARFRTVVAENARVDFLAGQAYSIIQPITQVLVGVLVLALLFAGRYLFPADLRGAAPYVLVYLFVLVRLLPLVSSINVERGIYLSTKAGFTSIEQIMEATAAEQRWTGQTPLATMRRGIRYEHVAFKYPDGTFALHDITFEIPTGSRTVIVGPSGSGKSTIIDLLAGFYVPDRGTIRVDGIALTDLDLLTWRRHLGVVSQETLLFNDTIWFNVGYSKPGATREAIVEACRRAQCHEFICSLPQGYDTVLGERAVRLSGGQRQRLSIARAFLADPEVLILDEATNALDRQSEELVQRAVEELMVGRTVIIVAHRWAAIEDVDQILLIEGGKLLRAGTHAALLENEPLYQRLYS